MEFSAQRQLTASLDSGCTVARTDRNPGEPSDRESHDSDNSDDLPDYEDSESTEGVDPGVESGHEGEGNNLEPNLDPNLDPNDDSDSDSEMPTFNITIKGGDEGSRGCRKLARLIQIHRQIRDLFSETHQVPRDYASPASILDTICSVTRTVTFGYFGAIRLKGYAKTLHI